jgi:type II secretory pathway component PulM
MKLNTREKSFIVGGAVVVVLLTLWFAAVEPLTNRRERFGDLTMRLKGDLVEMRDLSAQYKALQASRLRIERSAGAGGEATPFAYLESLARESGLTGSIESMTPVGGAEGGPTELDVRLAGIGLDELVNFLYRIESNEAVFVIVNLNIRPRYLSPDRLDVSLRLASIGTS